MTHASVTGKALRLFFNCLTGAKPQYRRAVFNQHIISGKRTTRMMQVAAKQNHFAL